MFPVNQPDGFPVVLYDSTNERSQQAGAPHHGDLGGLAGLLLVLRFCILLSDQISMFTVEDGKHRFVGSLGGGFARLYFAQYSSRMSDWSFCQAQVALSHRCRAAKPVIPPLQ